MNELCPLVSGMNGSCAMRRRGKSCLDYLCRECFTPEQQAAAKIRNAAEIEAMITKMMGPR